MCGTCVRVFCAFCNCTASMPFVFSLMRRQMFAQWMILFVWRFSYRVAITSYRIECPRVPCCLCLPEPRPTCWIRWNSWGGQRYAPPNQSGLPLPARLHVHKWCYGCCHCRNHRLCPQLLMLTITLDSSELKGWVITRQYIAVLIYCKGFKSISCWCCYGDI